MIPTELKPIHRIVFEKGFAPQFSTETLILFQYALEENSDKIVQGSTTVPAPSLALSDWPCQSACAIGSLAWEQQYGWEDGVTVSEIDEAFIASAMKCDALMNEQAACRYFLNWFDEGDRATVFAELSKWIDDIITERRKAQTREMVSK